MYKKSWLLRTLFLIIVLILILKSSSYLTTDKLSVTTSDNVLGRQDSEFQKKLYKVVKVVDGDTIDVQINGSVFRVRLIGIDTPEVVDPRKPVACFGKEASDKAKEILNGTSVYLENDPTQSDKDKYQRLLRYVFLENETNFNQFMIEEGFAHEYTYDFPYKYQQEFKNAEKDARENKKGLWGDKCLD